MKTTPLLPKGGVMFRHYLCLRCEQARRPNKRDAGITLHALVYKRFDRETEDVYFLQSCSICDCYSEEVKEGEVPLVSLLKQWAAHLPVKEWNCLFDFEDDGYED